MTSVLSRVKSLELGISIAGVLSRTEPQYLSGVDSAIRIRDMRENEDMLSDWVKLEKQNDG